jgi:hypothetical protein
MHAEEWGGRALLAYGDCEVEFGHGADGGCTVPIQLQERSHRATARRAADRLPRRPRPKPEDPDALLVFAGSTMIEISAYDARPRRACATPDQRVLPIRQARASA